MQVALMIPCYIDLFYPEVGVATLELLEKFKVDVVYPFDQTCCAQPMANGGCYEEAQATEELFIRNFSAFDHIVTPSGSCTHHLRNKFTAAPDSPERRKVSASVYDLVEFLHDVLQVRDFPWAKFERKVALHTSCSAIRGLGMASMSERVHDAKFSMPKDLLEHVPGIQFVEFERPDECCGFGGTFSVTEEAVAAKMGYDKLDFIGKSGADYLVSSDMSCLMHLQGCAHRLGAPLKVYLAHVMREHLQNVRSNQPSYRELPAIPKFHSEQSVDLKRKFAAALKELSGEVVTEPPADFEKFLKNRFPGAKVICSTVPEYAGSRVPEDFTRWSDASSIDVTIIRSPLAVAETGTVLFSEEEFRVNTIGVFAHDIVILLDPAEIVATANSEGMPVVGLGGAVPRAQRLKQAHQSLDTVTLFKPVTKYSAEVDAPEAIGEVLAAAFRAESGRPGAAFLSLPMDIMTGAAPNLVLAPVRPQELGAGPTEAIADAAQLINQAKLPVLLLGMQASEPANATAVRALLEKVPLPCVCTYQGAGIVPRSMIHFGPVDTVKYAEAFGAKGFAIKSPDEFAPTLRKALDMAGPVLIDIPVDYSHNLELGEQMHPDVIV